MTIAVTGLGAITALGATADATWDRLLRGERAFADVTVFEAEGYRSRRVAEVPGIAPCETGTASRTSELALRAAREALADAGIDPRDGGRIGLVVGGTTSGMLETESLLAVLLGPAGVDPALREEALSRMLTHPLSAATDRIAREIGPFARTRSLSSACSSGANAIMVGATWLELGLVDVALCGASDALCRVTLAGFNALGAIDPNGARPFDARRRGLTLGEGAGFLVLERADDARRRGKNVICTLLGWASRSEAHHITNPEPTGAAPASAMRAALQKAGVGVADVDYVNAHGTGTLLNDVMETKAIRAVLGERVERVPVSSVKGQIGHTLAAAGAVEAVVTALSVARGLVPPTGGLEEPDPECGLVHVRRAEERRVRVALTSSFGFGGMDTVLVLGAPDMRAPPPAPRRGVVITGAAELVPEPGAETVTLPEGELDPERSRRLDRTSRLAVAASARARGRTKLDPTTGVVLGSAFGALDATSAFMRRLREKGPRLVAPADFPTLVPSSPAGYASIYLGLGGPTLLVADLSTSGECALAQGYELIASGAADRMLVAAAEEKSSIVDAVLSVVFKNTEGAITPRKEGGAALVLEAEDAPRTEGRAAIARIADIVAFTDDSEDPLEALGEPPSGAVVVLANASAHALAVVDASPWSACRRVVCETEEGAHEAMGAIAIARGVAMLARGEARAVLFVASDRGFGYAGVLVR